MIDVVEACLPAERLLTRCVVPCQETSLGDRLLSGNYRLHSAQRQQPPLLQNTSSSPPSNISLRPECIRQAANCSSARKIAFALPSTLLCPRIPVRAIFVHLRARVLPFRYETISILQSQTLS